MYSPFNKITTERAFLDCTHTYEYVLFHISIEKWWMLRGKRTGLQSKGVCGDTCERSPEVSLDQDWHAAKREPIREGCDTEIKSVFCKERETGESFGVWRNKGPRVFWVNVTHLQRSEQVSWCRIMRVGAGSRGIIRFIRYSMTQTSF